MDFCGEVGGGGSRRGWFAGGLEGVGFFLWIAAIRAEASGRRAFGGVGMPGTWMESGRIRVDPVPAMGRMVSWMWPYAWETLMT